MVMRAHEFEPVAVPVLKDVSLAPRARVAEDASDGELLEAFVAGDSRAFHRLWARHAKPLREYLRYAFNNSGAFEDLLQEAFMALAVHARGIRDARTIRKYLMTVARRAAYLERRRARRCDLPELALFYSLTVPALDHDCRETLRIVERSLERMSTRRRDVFVLCCVERKTAEEAASELGVSPSTVRRELVAARRCVFRRLAANAVLPSETSLRERMPAKRFSAELTHTAAGVETTLSP